MAAALVDPLLIAVRNLIIVNYFFLLRSGDYTGYNLEITPFFLDYIEFSWFHWVIDMTPTEANLESTLFVTLTFTMQKRCLRQEYLPQDFRLNLYVIKGKNPLACPPSSHKQ